MSNYDSLWNYWALLPEPAYGASVLRFDMILRNNSMQ
jgi:hypothetical protein